MDKVKSKLREFIKNLCKKGFFSVFLSSAVGKIVTFIGGMIIVRVMSKEAYGEFTYIINCLGVLTICNDLGCSQATMQFCSEFYDDKEKYKEMFTFGLKSGLTFVLFSVVVVFFSPLFYPYNSIETAYRVRFLSLFPLITTVNSFLVANLRCSFQTKKYALANLFSSVINYVIILPLAYFYGLSGAVISKYIIAIAELLFLLLLSKANIQIDLKKNGLLTNAEKRDFIRLAFSSQLSSGISQIMVLMDIFVMGLVIKDTSAISSYKVGTIIPTALEFIPQSVMIMAVPYFAKYRNDKRWIWKNTKRVILYGIILYLMAYGFFFVFGPFTIRLLFGEKYDDSLLCLRILLVGFYFTSALRIPISNIVYTQRKVYINIIMSFCGGIINCILDYVMIIKWGATGVAIATTVTQTLIAVFYFVYLMCLFREQKNEL